MPKDLRMHLDEVQRRFPNEVVVIDKEIDPAFEINAILQQLDAIGKHPLCYFTNVRDLKGRPGNKVVVNVTPGRSLKRHVASLTCCHEVATRGTGFMSWSAPISVSVMRL